MTGVIQKVAHNNWFGYMLSNVHRPNTDYTAFAVRTISTGDRYIVAHSPNLEHTIYIAHILCFGDKKVIVHNLPSGDIEEVAHILGIGITKFFVVHIIPFALF